MGTLLKVDFDSIIDRRNTASEKWDRYADRDIIPLWVADMDFRSPPAVIEAPGFVRLNFGCPRPILLQGLKRIQQACSKAI